jgi:hypothetical protein
MRALAFVRKALFDVALQLRGRPSKQDRDLAIRLGAALYRLDAFDEMMSQHFVKETSSTRTMDDPARWLFDLSGPRPSGILESDSILEPLRVTGKTNSTLRHALSDAEREEMFDRLTATAYTTWAMTGDVEIELDQLDEKERERWRSIVRSVLRSLFRASQP